jgi:hypothetical protein
VIHPERSERDLVLTTCWHADPMHMGGRHASTRPSALAAPAAGIVLRKRTFVVNDQYGRPLGLGGTTG